MSTAKKIVNIEEGNKEIQIPEFLSTNSTRRNWCYIDKEEFEKKIRKDERMAIQKRKIRRRKRMINKIMNFSKMIAERIAGGLLIFGSVWVVAYTDIFYDIEMEANDGSVLIFTIPIGLAMLFGKISEAKRYED